jgi:hypothetical protein
MRARFDTDNLIEGETVEPPANGHKSEDPTIISGEIEEPSQPGHPDEPRS